LLEQIEITAHAVQRWRQRAISHASDNFEVIIEHFKKSRFLEKGDALPFSRQPDRSYYYLAEHDCYFAVEPLGPKAGRIITIILHNGFQTEPILAARKKKAKPLPIGALAINPSDVAKPGPLGQTPLPIKVKAIGPRDLSAGEAGTVHEKYQYFVGMHQLIAHELSSMAKSDPRRPQTVKDYHRVELLLRLAKSAKVEYERAHDEEIYRPDGSINFVVAFPMLLKRIEALEAEVRALKGGAHAR
jgi:hypothetical protein